MNPNLKKAARLLALILCCGMVFTACRPSTAPYELHDWQNWKIEVEADRATTEEDSDKEYIMDELQQQEEDAPEEETPDEVTAGVEAEEENTAERAILSLYDALELESSVAAALANPENAENTRDKIAVSSSLTGDNEDSDSVTPGGAVSEGGSTGTGSQGDGGGSLQLEDNNGEAEDPDIVVKPTHEQDEEDEEEKEEDESENDDGGDEDDDKDLEIYDEETGETNETTTISGAGKVAAVGEAAVLVCMLDGVDRLCATSESLVENTLAQRAFPVDEDECAVLWSGDGGDALSEEDFQTLLDINPDMCFYLSGSGTFTNSQITRLKAAGIVVTSLPDLTTIDGIEKAVYNLGVVLGDEAQEKANEYLDWCADLESELSGLDEVDTIYIQGWDDTAVTTVPVEGTLQYEIPGHSASGSATSFTAADGTEVWAEFQDGAALIRVGTDWDRVFLEYAVEYANITDRGEDPTRWYSDSDSRNSDAAEVCTPDGELCLISALYGGAYFDTVLTGSYDTLLNASGKTSDGEYYSVTTRAFDLLFGLGDVSFPAVIVSSSAVAEKIVGSRLWNLDTYSLEYSKWVTSDYNSLIVPVYTLLEPDYNPNTFRFGSPYYGPWYLCYSNILSSYGILVNPVGGIGSWTDGSAESVLESVWAASKLSGYSEKKMYEKIEEFYSTFYGLELTDVEVDLYVLAGR